MLSTIDLRGRVPSTAELRRALPRGAADVDSMLPTVRPVVEDVADNGVAAAMRYSEKFDHVVPESLVVPADVIAGALEQLDPGVRAALEESISRIRLFHEAQKPADVSVDVVPGGVVREKWIPVRRVGLYVPGGNAVYPSSVLMNVIPALAAGVESLVVASPPQADFGGWPHPTILAACALLGVTEVWAVGGGQAVALLSYGDEGEGLEPVDMVTGPGNIFVTAAKRLCRSVVGIDSEAGPTEIAILADATADPVAVAYDLISQAEHDVMAASVLITDSPELAEAVDREVAARYGVTLNADRVKQALEGEQSGIVLVDDMEVG
ncbi:histidinol dehydrogenase, partial [Corynebacterium xerosis]|uniref:histidinol dehydrogenase n=1 Tax=Corynebacterium xerosis TaxID=1725 RepID=UPI0027BAA0EF